MLKELFLASFVLSVSFSRGVFKEDDDFDDVDFDDDDFDDDERDHRVGCPDPDTIPCFDGSDCIWPEQRCDRFNDCMDGSDEEDCEEDDDDDEEEEEEEEDGEELGWDNDEWLEEEDMQNKPCRRGEFHCKADDKCVRSSLLCDGHTDCLDDSDEDGCDFRGSCRTGHFGCRDGGEGGGRVCVPVSWTCDGSRDCEDGSDEEEGCRVKGRRGRKRGGSRERGRERERERERGRELEKKITDGDGSKRRKGSRDRGNSDRKKDRDEEQNTASTKPVSTTATWTTHHMQTKPFESTAAATFTTSTTVAPSATATVPLMTSTRATTATATATATAPSAFTLPPTPSVDCPEDTFTCPNAFDEMDCLSMVQICDGFFDCVDSSEDESELACWLMAMIDKLKDAIRLDRRIKLDQEEEKEGEEEEEGEDVTCHKAWELDWFECDGGDAMFRRRVVCDGKENCVDGSDEADCDGAARRHGLYDQYNPPSSAANPFLPWLYRLLFAAAIIDEQVKNVVAEERETVDEESSDTEDEDDDHDRPENAELFPHLPRPLNAKILFPAAG